MKQVCLLRKIILAHCILCQYIRVQILCHCESRQIIEQQDERSKQESEAI